MCLRLYTVYLLQILVKYDITLIQEIRDSSETAIYDLLREVNRYVSSYDEKKNMRKQLQFIYC
jgi:hypothetical protein